MAVRTLALVGCALFACLLVGGGYPQTPTDPAPGSYRPAIPAPGGVLIPNPPAHQSPAIPQPPPKTVDQLIDNLTELRRQKAELEKKEQAVSTELREKLKQQRERLAKLGIEPSPTPPVPAAPEGASATGIGNVPVLPPAGSSDR